MTYQATCKFTRRAGRSSRFRGGDSVHWIKKKKTDIFTQASVDLLSYTVCAVKCFFKPTEQPRVGAVRAGAYATDVRNLQDW